MLFKSLISTVTQEKISVRDKNRHCTALFVDLSKAFDKHGHSLLPNIWCNIEMFVFGSIITYLSDSDSEWSQMMFILRLQLSKDDPQGSVLDPFYNWHKLYVICHVKHTHLYANNTTLVSYRKFEILFPCSTSRKSRSKERTSVNGADIERVAGYKYLSIWLDVTNLVEKLWQKNGALQKEDCSSSYLIRVKFWWCHLQTCCCFYFKTSQCWLPLSSLTYYGMEGGEGAVMNEWAHTHFKDCCPL